MIHRGIALDGELPAVDMPVALVVDDRLLETALRLRNRERHRATVPEATETEGASWSYNDEHYRWELRRHDVLIAWNYWNEERGMSMTRRAIALNGDLQITAIPEPVITTELKPLAIGGIPISPYAWIGQGTIGFGVEQADGSISWASRLIVTETPS